MLPVASLRPGDLIMVRGEGDPYFGERVEVLELPFYACARNGNMYLIKVKNTMGNVGYVDAQMTESL